VRTPFIDWPHQSKRGSFYFFYFVTFAAKGPEGRKPTRVPMSEGVDDSKEPRPAVSPAD
jgi:hypothetical protein